MCKLKTAKSAMWQLLPILLLLIMCSMTQAELFRDFEKRIYEENKWEVDRSAAMICYVVGGTLEEVKTGKAEYGYTCDVELRAYSDDKKEARDMCESTFPHYVVEAEQKGLNTRCKFVILNRCPDNYYLIYEKCYIVLDLPVNYKSAKEFCGTGQGNKTGAQLAEYSSSNLGMDLLHMEFLDVWMQVPDLNEHFANNKEEGGAVFAVKDSWKYEKKEGVLLMEDLESKHRPMCEFTPPKTLASMNYIIGLMNVPGMPKIVATDFGFKVDTSELCPRRSDCAALWAGGLGAIFDPLVPKVNGNSPDITFTVPKLSGGVCPDGWFRYERTNGQVMCHIAFKEPTWHLLGTPDTIAEHVCTSLGAHLTGFDSLEEVEAVIEHFDWLGKDWLYVELGGTNKCTMVGCNDPPQSIRTDNNGRKANTYNFGWLNGVASNLEFLYQHMDKYDLIDTSNQVDLELRFRSGDPKWEFVLWDRTNDMQFMCGKYADFV